MAHTAEIMEHILKKKTVFFLVYVTKIKKKSSLLVFWTLVSLTYSKKGQKSESVSLHPLLTYQYQVLKTDWKILTDFNTRYKKRGIHGNFLKVICVKVKVISRKNEKITIYFRHTTFAIGLWNISKHFLKSFQSELPNEYHKFSHNSRIFSKALFSNELLPSLPTWHLFFTVYTS